MPERSTSRQRHKVEQARAVVAQALGDAARRDTPQGTTKYVPVTKPTEPIEVKDESVLVLTIGEVATRLDISRAEVERIIASGRMTSLGAGFTVVVPTSEVQRFKAMGSA